MSPTLQTPPYRRGTPPLPNKLFDTRVKISLESAKKEIEAYLQNPMRTESEKVLARSMLDVVCGIAENAEAKELRRRLDDFFITLKDYEDAQMQVKESYETRLDELSDELDATKLSKGMLPFSVEALDKRIAELQRQRTEAVDVQIRAEDEWKEAERRMNSYKPAVGVGKSKVEEARRELQSAYETRNRNYVEITKTVEALKQKIDRLKAIKESIRILSTATLE